MVRRILLSSVAMAFLGISAGAAERATVILADGTRQSGEVVFHGSGNRNIIDNFLNLGDGGREKTIPVDQVAIIEFAGGEPSVAEFQQLPGDQAHLLVLRGGTMQRGTLINLVNGDTVQWRNEAGQTQQYGIRDVSRIFLNAQVSRDLFPQLATAATSSAKTSGAAAARGLPAGAIRVSADQAWVSTGIRVMKGQQVSFSTTGQVQFSANQAHTAGPDGSPSVQSANLPVAQMPVGGLIGRVGNSPPFPIGSNAQPIAMPDSGQLMLGVNDTDVSDNSGFFAVVVSQGRRR